MEVVKVVAMNKKRREILNNRPPSGVTLSASIWVMKLAIPLKSVPLESS